MVLFVPNVVSRVGFSVLNNALGSGDKKLFDKVESFNIALTTGCAAVAAAGVFLAHEFLFGLYGPDFAADGKPILFLMLLASIPESLSMVMRQRLAAKERFWLSFTGIVLPWRMALLLGTVLTLDSMGVIGIAYAYLGSAVIALLATFVVLEIAKAKDKAPHGVVQK